MSLCQIALAASRKTLFGVPLMLTMPLIAQASPIWSTGTPANAYMATPTPASPNFGGTLINFDSLPTSCGFPPSGCTNYSGTTFSGVTITSPDALNVIPYSSQSAPNELFDDSAGGSANITITTASGESAFGVGIAELRSRHHHAPGVGSRRRSLWFPGYHHNSGNRIEPREWVLLRHGYDRRHLRYPDHPVTLRYSKLLGLGDRRCTGGHPASRRCPTFRQRPRRDRFVWLAQKAEGCCYRSLRSTA